jgi:hypothetical protein
MLRTDAWAFLDIRNPLCAWNIYRGFLVSPPAEPGVISVWAAAVLRRTVGGDPSSVLRESALERVRKERFPQRVSRLRGLYCFLDKDSAEQALIWFSGRNHFRRDLMADLSLIDAGQARDRLDSNWITYSPRHANGLYTDVSWIDDYWRGTAMPDRIPVWESIVDGRLAVLGSSLRERAYDLLRKSFPESLMLLEIARIAAWIGSNLGNCYARLLTDEASGDILVEHFIDMRDADNPEMLSHMTRVIKEGHPVRWADIEPQVTKGGFGNAPDFRRLNFRIPIRF